MSPEIAIHLVVNVLLTYLSHPRAMGKFSVLSDPFDRDANSRISSRVFFGSLTRSELYEKPESPGLCRK